MCLLAIRLHNCVNRGKDIKKIDAMGAFYGKKHVVSVLFTQTCI